MADVDSLCLKIRHMLQANGLRPACFPVELLARECLNNAVIHGNRNDADKSIVLRLSVGREWIRLQVSDEGPGFRLAKGASKQIGYSCVLRSRVAALRVVCRARAVQPPRQPDHALDKQDEPKRKGRLQNGCLRY